MNILASGAQAAVNAFNYVQPYADHAIPKLLGDGKRAFLLTATGRLGAIGLSLAGTYLLSSAANDIVQVLRGLFYSFSGNISNQIPATFADTLKSWSDSMPKFSRMPNLMPNTDTSPNRKTLDKLASGLYACALGVIGWETMLLLSGKPSPAYNVVAQLTSPLRLIEGSWFTGAAQALAQLGVIKA